MAKQLNIDLSFHADTSQAKKAIEDLGRSLNQIQHKPSKLFDDTDLKKASQAAQELTRHLQVAVNVDTGKLDLHKFSQSLSNSNSDLNTLYSNLSRVGPEGKKAFLDIAKSINSADNATLNINNKLKDFGVTLKNTVRWQLSSMVIHEAISTYQEAIRYAEELNASLNDIRIVTGKNIDDMARFAEQANKAARSLSTTTTEYTNASLIYYQQGLSDEEVMARTDITIKMANAAGQSAKTISDQLTAVWNNFYDGSKSLEYYADVMTALGAATASSTDEISEGLNKFASVAETVGLSYEYAASALATVTATTRQSADIVGTAFKTLFARIQGLGLGETLDDGTTLNKYSAALQSVGISIFETNGEMKAMDKILDEMGTKWQTLSKDQQVALAQTVAGVRQYTQLIALMDNWDYFETNLSVANNSEGTLQAQADIQAESWEAARDRIKAAAEGLYKDLLNDEFFIDVLNIVEKVIVGVDHLIDSMGGFKTILLIIAGIFANKFAKEAPAAIKNLTDNIKVLTGAAEKERIKTLKENADALNKQATGSAVAHENESSVDQSISLRKDMEAANISADHNAELIAMQKISALKLEMAERSATLSEAEKIEYENKIKEIELHSKSVSEIGKEVDALKELNDTKIDQILTETNTIDSSRELSAEIAAQEEALKNLKAEAEEMAQLAATTTDTVAEAYEKMNNAEYGSPEYEQAEQEYNRALEDNSEKQGIAESLAQETQEAEEYLEKLIEIRTAMGNNTVEHREGILEQISLLQDLKEKSVFMESERGKIDAQSASWKKNASEIRSNIKAMEDEADKCEDASKQTEILAKRDALLAEEKDALKQKILDYGQSLEEAGIIGEDSFNLLSTMLDNTDDSMENLLNTFDTWKDFEGTFDGYSENMEELDESINNVTDSLIRMGVSKEAIDELSEQFTSGALTLEEYRSALEQLEEIETEMPTSSMKVSESISVVGGTILQLAGAVEAFKNIGNIWNDEDLTLGQKLIQTIGAVIPIVTTMTTVFSKQNLTQLAAASSSLAAALGFGTEATAALGASAATGTLNVSLATLWTMLWPIALIVGALALACWGLVTVFNAIKDATPEAKLKAAEEESARMAEELNKAREAADGLLESIDKYDSAVEKMRTLTEGTEEYAAALADANTAARELIDQYGEDLQGKYSFNAETGLLEFEDGALDDLQEMADKKVKTVEAQKLMADNSVIAAKQRIATSDAVSEGNIGQKFINKGLFNPITLRMALTEEIGDVFQGAGLSALEAAYAESGGNIKKAIESLDPMTAAMVASLGKTDAELQALCEASRANTSAILENNKQIIDAKFEGNKDYDRSENKAFLNEVLAGDLEQKTNQYRALKYSSMDKKTVAGEYAQLMGYDPSAVKVKKGVATFLDNDGNEVKVSVEQMKSYLAQEAALASLNGEMEKYVEKVDELQKAEEDLADAYERGTISYGEYKDEIAKVGKSLGLSQKEIDSYLSKYASENMVRAGREVALAEAFKGMGYGDAESYEFVNSFVSDLTNEQLEIAVNVAATTNSLDEFKREFQHAATDALINSFEATESSVSQMLAEADENGSFTSADFDTLEQDENFTKWLEEQGMTMRDIVNSNYTEQYNIISQFYADLQQLQQEALTQSIQNYEDDLAEYQAIMDYKMAQEQNNFEQMQAIRDAWGDSIDFEAYLEMDISDVQAKLDEAQAMIEEVTSQKYELDLSWDGVDQLQGSFDEMGDFASMMENDAKKVGNAYQLTAAQAEEWAKMYPELFANAKVTTDGLIELSEAEYQTFAAAQKEKRDAAIQAQIDTLEARLVELDAEEETVLRQKELYKSLAEGQLNLELAKAEDLVAIRQNLTDFYIDAGFDEVEANQKALQDMGLTQKQYNELIAQSAEDNAANMVNSTVHTVTTMRDLFSNLVRNLINMFSNLAQGIGNALTFNFDQAAANFKAAFSSGIISGLRSDWQAVQDTKKYNFTIDGTYTKYTSQAAYEEAKTNNLQAAMDELDKQLDAINKSRDTIKSQINILNALKNQDVSEYGSEDPNEVDETNDKEKKEKEERERQKKLKDMADNLERFHEITRAIEAQERALSRLAKRKDAAFGKDKVALMDEELAELEKQYENYEDMLSAVQGALILDEGNIRSLFTTAPVINDVGDIDNYSQLEAEAQRDLNAARIDYNNSLMDENAEAILEAAEKLYEQRMDALKTYEDTVDQQNETIEKMFDTRLEIQSKNYEKFSYKLEQDLAATERELEYIDYQLSKIEDDFYAAEEAAALMVGTIDQLNSGKFGGQMAIYKSNLEYAATKQAELVQLLNTNQISQEQYQEGLQKIREEYQNNIESLQNLDNTMKEYYSDTLSKAKAELQKYTAQMEHQNSILEHYMNLVELMGKSNDYDMINEILEGQVTVAENNAKISKAWYESRRADADNLKAQYEDAVASGASEAELDMLKTNWEAAEESAREAQDQMLSDAENWASSLKAVLENKLAKLGQILENALTGGYGSFNAMTTALERANSLQEGYLTTTNKIYETNKLMRQAQQEIDKSTNSTAKKRLAAFIEETQELQNQSELSEYELQIQQAKYDLLLAEMALEEAQDAKSTVRLQRDSEGNFGYVYTADANQISEAQQQLEDAQNKLYNIGLDGANEYAEKYQQTMAEMYDTFADIQQQKLSGAFETEEEYHRAMESAKDYYYQLLQKYSNQYSIALTTDSRVVADAWSTDFSSMIYDTERWMTEVDNYVDGTTKAFQAWQSAVTGENGVTSIIGKNVGEVAGKVKNVADESKSLADITVKQVIPALDSEITSVDNLTGSYARMRDTIMQVIEQYGLLIKGINDETKQDWNSDNNYSNVPSGNGNATGTENTVNSNGVVPENNNLNGNGNINSLFDNTTTSAEPYLAVGSQVTVKSTATHFSRDGGSGTKMKDFVKGSTYSVMDFDDDEVCIGRGSVVTGWVNKKDLIGFDTGGYTGSWDGAYGKLALLHQKEMVLNAYDTENLLASMEVLNRILEVIDLQSMNAQMGGLLSSPSWHGNNESVIEQQITIEANFPAAQDRNEIEEAFNNLLNKASQYANRK